MKTLNIVYPAVVNTVVAYTFEVEIFWENPMKTLNSSIFVVDRGDTPPG